MRVATYQDIRQLTVEETVLPELGPEDAVIAVGACGICGSDVHSFLEGAWIQKGQAMGHEFAGTVTKVGSDVSGISVGDRITVKPALGCGECDRCQEGRGNLCVRGSHSTAGYADEVLVRQVRVGANVFVMPDSLSFTAAAFLEPLSVAMRAVNETNPRLDEPILVTGLGAIGQCVVQVLLARGAKHVIGSDTSAARREAAKKSGLELVYNPLEVDLEEVLREKFGTTSSPYRPVSGNIGTVIECSGAAPVYKQIFNIVRAGGAVGIIALTAEPVMIDPNPIVQKEIRVVGSFAYTDTDTAQAFELLASGAVNPEHLVTHEFALADINEAFDVQSRSDESVKVMIHP